MYLCLRALHPCSNAPRFCFFLSSLPIIKLQDSYGVKVLGDTQKKQIAIPCAMPISLIYAHVLKALRLVYRES